MKDRPPFIAIALISAAALGYEVLLTRLFSITLWHHFAYMIISAALLGYGASGTFLVLARSRLETRFDAAFVASAATFGLSIAPSFLLAQRISFNPLELFWDPRQALYLLGLYLVLFVPFFCAGTCTGLAFSRFRGRIHRVYAADILGAGAGSLGIVLALFAFPPVQALTLLSALGLLAAAIAALETRSGFVQFAALLAGAGLMAAIPAESWIELRPSPYKELSQTLQVAGARVVARHSSPLAQITVVESPRVPFRHAPGMSLASPAEPAPQLAVFSDGEGLNPLTRFDGDLAPLAYLDYLTSALPYHLKREPRVLVLGAGAGADVLQALYHRSPRVDAVELDPQVVALLRGQFAGYAGRLYERPELRVHVAEARGFVAGSPERYDLIQVALVDAFSVASAGLHALSESYLYTVEALQDYLGHLQPDGLLAVTRWVTLPPRDTLKLFATAVAALKRSGLPHPERRLALIRGWKTATLIVKNGEFNEREIAALRAFCRTRSFDPAYFPGIAPDETNRYNRLDESYFYDGATALLSPRRDAFIEGYKFHIEPATDDRPYFFRFLRWRSLPEILALKDRGGLPLLEWGYPVLAVALAQAVAAGALLILLPLPRIRGETGMRRGRVAAYFLGIGLGFMFLEIAFIQKFILFLAHPLYAVAVVLCAFLVFAGLGSLLSRSVVTALERATDRPLRWVAAAIGAFALAYIFVLPPLFRELMGLPGLSKVAISVAAIAPLAFLLGLPFPTGLARVGREAEALIPWAWAVNGCASVVGAVLAALLAVHLGFTVVVILAVVLYLLALGVAFEGTAAAPNGQPAPEPS
ncbi:MAG: SAM-dependent methyltransferase [Betaproteobacteria bacterium]|nr:SAM-dependent methyltransferase [Betaproteobacteria bacterium]